MTNNPQWDLSRFWQTLTYFEVIPFLNCLQRLFQGTPHSPKIQALETSTMGVILFAGTIHNLSEQVIQRLLDAGYAVRVATEDSSAIKAKFGTTIDIIDQNAELSQIMQGVQTLIYCSPTQNDPIFATLADTAKDYLGTAGETMLFNFTQPSAELQQIWGAVDDVVMGGVSQSELRLTDDSALFTGYVSTANSGGFASVRTKNLEPPLNLTGYQGIRLKIKGDGKRYKFLMRSENKWDGVAYSHSFDTVTNQWQTIEIPFTDLIPVFRAKVVRDAGIIDSSRIYALQLMLSKFEYDGGLNSAFSPGGFGLQIQSIRAYGGTTTPKLMYLTPEFVDIDQGKNSYSYLNGNEIIDLCVKSLK